MPKTQTSLYKYKCKEPFCGNILRQDKWPTHCRKEHTYKLRRYGCESRFSFWIFYLFTEWLPLQN